ncbi:hypothetical protein M422DRAFT_776529 [Sphaerobolus stellatus SS14]|nr:hypothetical protein M422DRAFT_776529 [Sphaerobolus stellatus SS14]
MENINENRHIIAFAPALQWEMDNLRYAMAQRNSNLSTRAYLGPGRLLGEYTEWLGGKLEETIGEWAHYFGYGPIAEMKQIEKMFHRSPKEVEKQLDVLYFGVSGVYCSLEEQNWLQMLCERCEGLMKYTLPSESPQAQAEAFKHIISLCTTYPHIRHCFLLSQYIRDKQFNQETTQFLSALWKRSDGFCGTGEWKFYQPLALASLSENEVTNLIEESKLGGLFELSGSKSSAVEKLLRLHDDPTVPREYRMLAIRYLCGFLRLTYYWEYDFDSTWSITKKLLEAAYKLFEDIFNTLPLLQDQATNEILFDEDGVDLFMETLLLGLNTQAARAKASQFSQDWLTQTRTIIDIIERHAEEYIPEVACLKRTHDVRAKVPVIYEGILLEEFPVKMMINLNNGHLYCSAGTADGALPISSTSQEDVADAPSVTADTHSISETNDVTGCRPSMDSRGPNTQPKSQAFNEEPTSLPVNTEPKFNANNLMKDLGSLTLTPLTDSALRLLTNSLRYLTTADREDTESVSNGHNDSIGGIDLSSANARSDGDGFDPQERSHRFPVGLALGAEAILNAGNSTESPAQLAALEVPVSESDISPRPEVIELKIEHSVISSSDSESLSSSPSKDQASHFSNINYNATSLENELARLQPQISVVDSVGMLKPRSTQLRFLMAARQPTKSRSTQLRLMAARQPTKSNMDSATNPSQLYRPLISKGEHREAKHEREEEGNLELMYNDNDLYALRTSLVCTRRRLRECYMPT